jgi:hypothetical protein
MANNLKTHHLALLGELIRERRIAVEHMDGRLLRPLKREMLVVERGGFVSPTPAGEALHRSLEASPRPLGSRRPESLRLSTPQEQALRMLCRQSEPVLADHLDGRVLRGLKANGMAVESSGWVTPTEAGRAHFELIRRRPRRAPGPDAEPRSVRAEVILRHVEGLERAIRGDAEIKVGDIPAYADDVLEGLRQYARELERVPAVRRSA